MEAILFVRADGREREIKVESKLNRHQVECQQVPLLECNDRTTRDGVALASSQLLFHLFIRHLYISPFDLLSIIDNTREPDSFMNDA